jgi:hypothetical protein
MITLKNSTIALALVMLVSLNLTSGASEPDAQASQVLHRTVKIDGLDIFYREPGRKMLPPSCCFTASRRRRICSAT